MSGLSGQQHWLLDVNVNNPNRPAVSDVYDFVDILGSGTFSEVVLAVHNETKSKAAVKIIDKAKLKSAKQKWRIQNEIALHKRCNHPYLVKLLDYYESDIDVCIVLELCEGKELFDRIVKKGYFSEKSASRIIRQLCVAIQYLHSLGVVHRDIKPENILFVNDSEEADIKLADFGLAKKLDNPSPGRALLKASSSGTTAYCAPERLSQAQESKAVDMWSIGCIMYFLLFGQPPFYSNKEDESEVDDEIMEAVLSGKVDFESRHVSDMAKDLIMRLLDSDPSRRITADAALQHPFLRGSELETLALDQPTTTNKSGNRAHLKSSINRVIDVAATARDDD